MERKKRLFVAVNVPEKVKEEIADFLQMIPKEKWRTIKQENLHVTMCFLGDVEEKKEETVKEKLQALSGFGEFEMELNDFGHFNGKVLWIGVGKGTDELNLLSKKICEALEVRGEKFHAHITLARNKSARPGEVKQLVEKMNAKGYRKKMQVKSIELMQSFLHSSGPEYKKVLTVPIAP